MLNTFHHSVPFRFFDINQPKPNMLIIMALRETEILNPLSSFFLPLFFFFLFPFAPSYKLHRPYSDPKLQFRVFWDTYSDVPRFVS